jgi:hypothetical protein
MNDWIYGFAFYALRYAFEEVKLYQGYSQSTIGHPLRKDSGALGQNMPQPSSLALLSHCFSHLRSTRGSVSWMPGYEDILCSSSSTKSLSASFSSMGALLYALNASQVILVEAQLEMHERHCGS